MKHARTFILSLAVLLVPFAVYAQTPARARDRAELLALRPNRTETVKFESRLVGKVLPYNVVLPADYDRPASRRARYPVLFLLHGLTGHYTDWLARTKLASYAAPHQFIIVTPEGNDGWYTDSAGVASDKYETYILEELIADVARRYRTLERREARAVAGLSMGGYGALKFGVKHPSRFVLAASMSGAVGAASWRTEADLPPSPLLRRTLVETFGNGDTRAKAASDLFKLFRELPAERTATLPFFYLDCGTEDELGLLPANRALADILVERKIPHEYRQLPGKHNWAYWDAQVQEVLRLASRIMSEGRK